MVTKDTIKVGGLYNWKGQEERLKYIGHNWCGDGFWHQFELITAPGKVWCEVQDDNLVAFEETSVDGNSTTATNKRLNVVELGLAAAISGSPGLAYAIDALSFASSCTSVPNKFTKARSSHKQNKRKGR